MKVRLLVAYDGAAFSGFARNLGIISVAETLETMIGAICGEPIVVTGAGRTDKGVHARGQVVSFEAPETLDPAVVQRSITKRTGGSIVIHEAAVAEPEFDARFSARWRRYRYTIVNRPMPEVDLRHTAWHVREPLSMEAMLEATAHFVGSHDFTAFCRRPSGTLPGQVSLVRRVISAEWSEAGNDILRFEITASAFCHQMVRSIVGTLVDVGRGHLSAHSIPAILEGGDRSRAGQLAPPHGLSLHEVGYDASGSDGSFAQE